jgi:hypothetical protein
VPIYRVPAGQKRPHTAASFISYFPAPFFMLISFAILIHGICMPFRAHLKERPYNAGHADPNVGAGF